MDVRQPGAAIPPETALALCAEIREKNRSKWYSMAYWQCWGCQTFSRGMVTRMCFSSETNCRGCQLVNRLNDGRQSR
jgi:hypothetical protein